MTHVHLPLTPAWLLWPQPWVWLLCLLVLLPVFWLVWLHPQRRPVIRFSGLSELRSAGGAWRRHLRFALPALRTVALGCLIIAAARPQTANESRRTVVEGIAIQMVLDISTSMRDLDLSPPGQQLSRLDVVKDVFQRFVTGGGDLPGRPNDLIGMIRFARYPDSVCPLTLDREVLLSILDETHTIVWLDQTGRWRGNKEEDGTAIGDALALAVERLKDLKRTTGSGNQLVITGRVAIVLTDGQNNTGMITPQQAGELAATYGIKVYTIMAGKGERLPWGGQLPIDDSDLQRIAEVTGGRHFRSDNAEALEQIYEQIDQLERTRTEEQSHVEWGELAWMWLVIAFVCLAVQMGLDHTLLRKIP